MQSLMERQNETITIALGGEVDVFVTTDANWLWLMHWRWGKPESVRHPKPATNSVSKRSNKTAHQVSKAKVTQMSILNGADHAVSAAFCPALHATSRWHLKQVHCAKSHRHFKCFVNGNCKLQNELKVKSSLREMLVQIRSLEQSCLVLDGWGCFCSGDFEDHQDPQRRVRVSTKTMWCHVAIISCADIVSTWRMSCSIWACSRLQSLLFRVRRQESRSVSLMSAHTSKSQVSLQWGKLCVLHWHSMTQNIHVKCQSLLKTGKVVCPSILSSTEDDPWIENELQLRHQVEGKITSVSPSQFCGRVFLHLDQVQKSLLTVEREENLKQLSVSSPEMLQSMQLLEWEHLSTSKLLAKTWSSKNDRDMPSLLQWTSCLPWQSLHVHAAHFAVLIGDKISSPCQEDSWSPESWVRLSQKMHNKGRCAMRHAWHCCSAECCLCN